jgi:hypothetical protein
MADETPPAPAMSRNDIVQAAIKDALAQETQPSTEKAPEAPPAAEVAKEAPKEAAKRPEEKGFEKLMREKAALRPYQEVAKTLPVESLQALAKAKAAGDPMAALKALGFSYADVAEKAATTPPPSKAVEAEEESPTVAALKAQVAELRQERQAEKSAKLRTEALEKAKEAIKGKHKMVEGMGAEDKVLAYIEAYWQQTQEMPGENFEESIEIAAAAVEKELEKEAEKWRKVLTPANPVPNVTDGASGKAPAGTGTPGKTLTNSSASAPSRGVPEPQSRDELFKQILADPNW